MMGQQQQQKELFSYQIDLDRRVRADNPLRQVATAIDFSFARAEVEATYGYNGNISIDPAVIFKMMFLLFFDNVRSERQLMEILQERLDYLWFLGYGINDPVPHHSVLSKARARWGSALFEKLFVRTVAACVSAGLVDGTKIHVDGSLIAAHASKKSIVEGPPELIAALREAYREQAAKLEESAPEPSPQGAANQTRVSTTDPDAQLVRRHNTPSRLSYKQHQVVDDAQGVITAQCTTGGSVAEDGQLFGLIQQHEHNTSVAVESAVADSQYGTAENFLACADRGIDAHMADLKTARKRSGQRCAHFGEDQFVYDSASDTYRCPPEKRCAAIKSGPTNRLGSIRRPDLHALSARCARNARTANAAGAFIATSARKSWTDCASSPRARQPKRIAVAGSTSWRAALPMRPIAMASRDPVGAGSGVSKSRIT